MSEQISMQSVSHTFVAFSRYILNIYNIIIVWPLSVIVRICMHSEYLHCISVFKDMFVNSYYTIVIPNVIVSIQYYLVSLQGDKYVVIIISLRIICEDIYNLSNIILLLNTYSEICNSMHTVLFVILLSLLWKIQ